MVERFKNEAGYSLVEVIVAIFLLGAAIIPMVGMFDAGLRASVVGSNYDRGRAIVSEELAEIQALPFSSPDPEPTNNTENSVVEIYPPSNKPAPRAGLTSSPKPCTGTMPSGFTCEVETEYSRPDGSGVDSDDAKNARTMMQATITVRWNGGGEYRTIGLVSKGSE